MSTPPSSAQQEFSPGLVAFPGKQFLSAGAIKEPLHLAIGMFDGVHLGHLAVIRQAVNASKTDRGSISGVLTFDPHPSRVLRPQQATPLLLPLEQRVDRMLSNEIDRVFVQAFTRAYASREAGDFLVSLKAFFPCLKSIHVGENFRFGAGRSGDVSTLAGAGGSLGVVVGILERQRHNGKPISSSAIRAAIGEGDMDMANSMLGSPYSIQGVIVSGEKVGRGLGFPTVNIPWHPEASPRFGVYAVTVQCASSGENLRGIANYGVRPTVNKTDSPLLEVHFLEGKSIPTTGDYVNVSLLAFLRPEKSFPSKEALQQQIQRDVESIRGELFKNGGTAPSGS